MHALKSLASVVVDMKNPGLIKRDRKKFKGCSMASIKRMRLVYKRKNASKVEEVSNVKISLKMKSIG